MTQREMVRGYFDSESRRWDDIYRVERPWRGRDQNFFSRLQHVKNLIKDSRGDLLDIGCGAGFVTAALYHPGIKSIQGIDFAPSMVAQARDYACRAGLPVPSQFHVVDAEKTGFVPESFDVITAIGVLEYTDSPLSLLTECARIARPGAAIVMTAPNPLSFSWNWESKIVGPTRKALRPFSTVIKYKMRGRTRPPQSESERIRHVPYTSREIASLAEQAGLVLERYVYCTFAWSTVEAILPIGGPVTRLMDRVAAKTWLSWPACNLIVRLRRM